jgi:hypothetical protein
MAMQAGRKHAKEKAMEGMIPGQETIKTSRVKSETIIVGYALDNDRDWAFPVFRSEQERYKGRIFHTRKEAMEAI